MRIGLATIGCVVVAAVGTGAIAAETAGESGLVRIHNGILTVTYNTDRESFVIHRGERAFAEGERFNAASGIEVRVRDLSDDLGAGRCIEEADASGQTVTLALYDGLPFVCVRTAIRNAWDQPIAINELEPVALRLNLGASPADLNILGCDGLRPGTEARTSYTFLAVAEPKTRAGAVCGWLTQMRGSGTVQSEAVDGRVQIVGETEYGGKFVIPPGETREGEIFAVGFFDDAHAGLESYADAIAKANRIELPDVPSGYCTWYHAGAGTERGTAQLAEFCGANLRDFGFEVIQIDDKWQVGNRDFTSHKPDGPYRGGMKATADAISANGLTPGLWLIPFGWDHTAPALADHPDWFVHREDGSIYAVEWAGDCLDMSHLEARAFLSDVIRRMTVEWGFSYLKIDGLWSGMAVSLLYPEPAYRPDGLGDAVFYDPAKTNVEVYRDGLKLVREAAGEDVYLLGCNIAQNMRTLGASVGLVDGMRVGRDIGADWPAILPSAQIGAHLYFLHGKVWYNDPDCLMLREPLTLDQARAWGSWIGVSGQMNLVSEWLPRLPPERLDIVKRTMPNHARLGRPVDLFESEFPRVWRLEVQQAGMAWDVVALFNWDADAETDAALDLAALGLPASGEARYVGFDFWENQFVAPFAQKQSVRLRPSSCRVIALHRLLERPQLVSTSRHVTQGAVDLVSVDWDDAGKVLRGVSRVVAGDPYELRIAVPSDTGSWTVRSVGLSESDTQASASIAVTEQTPNVRVAVTSPGTREVAWEVVF